MNTTNKSQQVLTFALTHSFNMIYTTLFVAFYSRYGDERTSRKTSDWWFTSQYLNNPLKCSWNVRILVWNVRPGVLKILGVHLCCKVEMALYCFIHEWWNTQTLKLLSAIHWFVWHYMSISLGYFLYLEWDQDGIRVFSQAWQTSSVLRSILYAQDRG